MTASTANFLKTAQQLERLTLDLCLSKGEFADEVLASCLAEDRKQAVAMVQRLEDFIQADGLPETPARESRAAALKVANALQNSSIALYGLLLEGAQRAGDVDLADFCREAIADKRATVAALRGKMAEESALQTAGAPEILVTRSGHSAARIPETRASKGVRYYQKDDGIEVAIFVRVKSWKHQTPSRVLAKAWVALAEAISASRKRPARKPAKPAIPEQSPTQPLNEAANPTGSGAWWQF